MLEQQPTTTQVQPSLDQALASFAKHQPIPGQVQSSTLQATPEQLAEIYGDGEAEATEEAEVQQQTETTEVEETEATEETTEESTVPTEFAEQFKQVFGLEPAEAVETFNSLIAFRDEVRLMGEWQITPSEYQSRMSEVREFYKSLPDEGREQFNSVEGAIAIWNHLAEKGGTPKKTSVKPAGRKVKTADPKPRIYTSAELAKMSPEEYNRNLPDINKAFREGRVR